jgi:hypothetical protein
MVLDDPGGGMPARSGGDAGDARFGLEFDDDRAEETDAPARPLLAVGGVARHRIGDQAVHQPVPAAAGLEIGAAPRLRVDRVDAYRPDGEVAAHAR